MLRKIVVMILIGTICLIGANSLLASQPVAYSDIEEYEKLTGNKIKSFSEAPMLTELVNAGKLPPVKERLPEEPLVVQPADEIGKYGGVMSGYYFDDLNWDHPLTYSSDLKEIEPNIIKSWEVSEDARTFTFHLRKGMRWSDGYPFTADDFMFWYEDVVLNKELSPAGIPEFTEEMGKLERIDDYTIKFSFVEPYGIFLERMCRWRPRPYLPKHYLKQFHPNYTTKDELDKIMKKGGFDNWTSLFASKSDTRIVGRPTISPWMSVSTPIDPVRRYERNPYYWKIDTAGNQLPYIDVLDDHMIRKLGEEGKLLQALAGEIDISERLDTQDYAILKQNEKRGNYRLIPITTAWCKCQGVLHFNYSSKDPVVRKILLDKRFRIALSVAMERDEINGVLYHGMSIPSQPGPPDGPPYHGELPMFHIYTQYDPQLANHLLDVMGLKWDKGHNVRLRPDGKPLDLVITCSPKDSQLVEMYKKYWKEIGVQITIRPGLVYVKGRWDLMAKSCNYGGVRLIMTALRWEVIPVNTSWVVNPPWAVWLLTDGEKGEEPPEGVKRLFEIKKEFMSEPDEQKRIALTKEIYLNFSENFWTVGTLKQSKTTPQLWWIYCNNRIKNAPDPFPVEQFYCQGSTFFIEE